MNLGQIELTIFDKLSQGANPDPAVRRQVRSDINITHRQILGMKGYGILRRATLPATSVAGSPLMVLPQSAVAIIAIIDRSNNRILRPISIQDVRYRDPGQNFIGSVPDAYAVINYASSVALDPSAAASLYAVSDSVSDGSGMTVTVEGIITGGAYQKSTVSLMGLTGVNLSSTISTWTHVLKFYLSALATGNITLREGSIVGTELARISPGQSYPRYTQIYLSGIPAASQTYYCDVELHVEDMSSISDEPLVPEDFHWLLISGALQSYYLKRKDYDSLRAEIARWNSGIGNLSTFLRRRGGVSVGGQRSNDPYRPSSYSNSPWMNG